MIWILELKVCESPYRSHQQYLRIAPPAKHITAYRSCLCKCHKISIFASERFLMSVMPRWSEFDLKLWHPFKKVKKSEKLESVSACQLFAGMGGWIAMSIVKHGRVWRKAQGVKTIFCCCIFVRKYCVFLFFFVVDGLCMLVLDVSISISFPKTSLRRSVCCTQLQPEQPQSARGNPK